MSRIKVHQNKSNFTLDGKPFFYLADTIWSAFTNITLDEWEHYLKLRKMQGFTVLQINTMPQWDRCMSDVGVYPFVVNEDNKFDFSSWNEEYYSRAQKMCQIAVDEGFQLALIILWLNYVPGTWGSRMFDTDVMPEEFVEEYTEKIISVFDQFCPIYVISGDTDFETQEAIRYYRKALDMVCRMSPDSLKSVHIKRAYDSIPEEFLDKIDFYMFQSGHNAKEQEMAYILPERIKAKYPEKPMINSEPCYEQMGFSRQEYGRFQTRDTRKAAWSSILSGACAGVAYGAHGVWNWQKVNLPKNPIMGEGFDEALPWQDAVKYPGAWDYGFIRYILEDYHVQKLIPANEYLERSSEDIRMAVAGDNYFIYLPFATNLKITGALEGYKAKIIDLNKKYIAHARLEVHDKYTEIALHPFEEDVLIILEKDV